MAPHVLRVVPCLSRGDPASWRRSRCHLEVAFSCVRPVHRRPPPARVARALRPQGSREGTRGSRAPRALDPSILACDFVTVDTVLLRRLYVLAFISVGSRRIEYFAITRTPDTAWMRSRRNLLMELDDRDQQVRFLLHDCDAKVGTVRRECLDRLCILGRRQLEHVLREYVKHYNGGRPHRALDLRPPDSRIRSPIATISTPQATQVNRRDLLGGLRSEPTGPLYGTPKGIAIIDRIDHLLRDGDASSSYLPDRHEVFETLEPFGAVAKTETVR
jgi:hypothetical protein